MLVFYRLLTAIFYPFYAYCFLPRRLKNGKEDPIRFREKLGCPSHKKDTKKLVWFHAASVGESLSLLKLVQRFMTENPSWQVLITSGTMTSAKIIEDRFPKGIIHQYAPLDFVSIIDRFLNHWQPDLMVWVESELWPNLIQKAHHKKIPLLLLNMRLSPRSFKRWAVFKKTFLKLLNCFNLILTQTKELDKNLKEIGYKKSSFCGNLKYAADTPHFEKQDLNTLQKALENRLHWMAASTHKHEEEIVLRAHKKILEQKKNACLILVVRHPNRADNVAQLIKDEGLTFQKYSTWKETEGALTEDVLLVDQMGIMGLFYELSTFVFVAGSLIESIGGHNILEPLRQNCITLHGPYLRNFKEVVSDAKKATATLEIQNDIDLSKEILALMNDAKDAKTYLKNGACFIEKQGQVLTPILQKISPYLRQGAPHERT